MSELSRRQLLTVAGLTIGAAWVELDATSDSPAAAAPPAGRLSLEPVADDPVALLSTKGDAPEGIPRHLAVRIRGEGVALAAGTQVKVAFDRRLYSPLSSPLITVAGRRVPATATTEQDAATGQTVCVLTLGADVPAAAVAGGETIALLGTANAHNYPHDLTVTPTTVAAGVTAHGPAARLDLMRHRAAIGGGATKPWGIEVGAGWEKVTWGPDGRYWYWYPVIAALRGTGPGRSPAAELTVTVDPQVVETVSVTSARLNRRAYATSRVRRAGSTTTGTVRQLRWRTDARLDAGDQLDIMLRVTTRSPSGPLATITHPIVAGGMGAAAAARQTGLTSVSRADSSWEG